MTQRYRTSAWVREKLHTVIYGGQLGFQILVLICKLVHLLKLLFDKVWILTSEAASRAGQRRLHRCYEAHLLPISEAAPRPGTSPFVLTELATRQWRRPGPPRPAWILLELQGPTKTSRLVSIGKLGRMRTLLGKFMPNYRSFQTPTAAV